jgi:transposase
MYPVFALSDRDIDLMAKAYSDDLRCKLLVAYDAGQGSLRVLAERFSVSYDYAKKVSAQRLRTGESKRVEQSRHGRVSRVTPEVEAHLLRLLREQPDRILVELQQDIKAAAGVDLSRAHLWRVLKRLGLRLKKSHSTPPSVTPKPTASGASSTLPASAKRRRRS